MSSKIKYLIYYNSTIAKEQKRIYYDSAVNKADYVIDSLADIGYDVEIVSPSWSHSVLKYYSAKSESLRKGVSVTYLPTLSLKGSVGQFLSYVFSMIQLFFYLIRVCDKGEHIFVYHTQAFARPLLWAKRIKKFHICLEVEEVYYRAFQLRFSHQKLETAILNEADSYIFVNDYLDKEINKEGKPSAVLYGAYKKCARENREKNSDIKKLVYAGMIDTKQKDAFNAVRMARELNSHYALYIIGKGNEESLERLEECIKAHNKEFACKITYDGFFEGQALYTYLSGCDFGLNIRECSEGYSLYSFPSKLLMYVSCGLQVLTTPIRCVQESSLAESFLISESDSDYKGMAEMIMNYSDPLDNTNLVEKLDSDFKKKLALIG